MKNIKIFDEKMNESMNGSMINDQLDERMKKSKTIFINNRNFVVIHNFGHFRFSKKKKKYIHTIKFLPCECTKKKYKETICGMMSDNFTY